MAHFTAGLPQRTENRDEQITTPKNALSRAISITSRVGIENLDPIPNHIPIPEAAPSPMDFVSFFPWMCQRLGLYSVTVIKLLQEPYTPLLQQKYKKATKVAKSSSNTSTTDSTLAVVALRPKVSRKLSSVYSIKNDNILIQAYHNTNDRLVEICINSCDIITQKHIKALTLCMPFHSLLYKVNISKCSLFQEVLYEMGNLLPESNITELFLDDTFCRQGNYYVLLQYASKLKRLSMNRCEINDAVVHEIFSKLCADASKTLQILELSSNFITDNGALVIGKTLRTNRVLIHLNLAGNRITDKGLAYIMSSLMKFQLTDVEILNKKKRNVQFIKRKLLVYQSCVAEQLKIRQRQLMSLGTSQSSSTSKAEARKPRTMNAMKTKKTDNDINAIAEKQTQLIMGGPFTDVFDNEQTRFENGKIICKGNFKLVSINLAYNNLTHIGMKTILKVLEYQASTIAPNKIEKGLVRIVADGNNLCETCIVLDDISQHLRIKLAAIRAEVITNTKGHVIAASARPSPRPPSKISSVQPPGKTKKGK